MSCLCARRRPTRSYRTSVGLRATRGKGRKLTTIVRTDRAPNSHYLVRADPTPSGDSPTHVPVIEQFPDGQVHHAGIPGAGARTDRKIGTSMSEQKNRKPLLLDGSSGRGSPFRSGFRGGRPHRSHSHALLTSRIRGHRHSSSPQTTQTNSSWFPGTLGSSCTDPPDTLANTAPTSTT